MRVPEAFPNGSSVRSLFVCAPPAISVRRGGRRGKGTAKGKGKNKNGDKSNDGGHVGSQKRQVSVNFNRHQKKGRQ